MDRISPEIEHFFGGKGSFPWRHTEVKKVAQHCMCSLA